MIFVETLKSNGKVDVEATEWLVPAKRAIITSSQDNGIQQTFYNVPILTTDHFQGHFSDLWKESTAAGIVNPWAEIWELGLEIQGYKNTAPKVWSSRNL